MYFDVRLLTCHVYLQFFKGNSICMALFLVYFQFHFKWILPLWKASTCSQIWPCKIFQFYVPVRLPCSCVLPRHLCHPCGHPLHPLLELLRDHVRDSFFSNQPHAHFQVSACHKKVNSTRPLGQEGQNQTNKKWNNNNTERAPRRRR